MSVYNLDKDGDKFLSKRLQAKEFASNVNGVVDSKTIIVEDELPIKLDQLGDNVGAEFIIVNSGYRTSKCDKAVGGTGSGTHCEGKAADCTFKDKNGKVIDTKYICCVAQDMGFGGIARISDRSIHLDIRKGNKYYGDEMMGHTRSVTTDFYKYFNIKKGNYSIEKVCKKFGLDNDFWQKNYNTDLGKECILELFTKISKKI